MRYALLSFLCIVTVIAYIQRSAFNGATETIEICKEYDFLVLFTSTVGWHGDHALAEAIKRANPTMKICELDDRVSWINCSRFKRLF